MLDKIFLLDDTVKNNICFVENNNIINEDRFNDALNLSYSFSF